MEHDAAIWNYAYMYPYAVYRPTLPCGHVGWRSDYAGVADWCDECENGKKKLEKKKIEEEQEEKKKMEEDARKQRADEEEREQADVSLVERERERESYLLTTYWSESTVSS